jgi:RNA polymerase sigma-70 factor (ECF subfamily)
LDRLGEAAARFQRGDPAAFQEIVEGTADRLVRLCSRILGNLEDGEDAAQEAYLKAYRALLQGQFDGRSSLRTWLYRVATNTALDQLRNRKARPEAAEGGPLIASPELAEQRLALAELAGWLGGLPEEQRVALVLSAVEGLSSAEIGAILGCSEGAVEQRLVRARAALRKKRGGDGHGS